MTACACSTQGRSGFTIPMRGNEFPKGHSRSYHRSVFTIPMRGNEEGKHTLSADLMMFTIPMRGNERARNGVQQQEVASLRSP